MKKKLLVLILTLAVVFSMLPQVVFAEESEDTDGLYERTIMMYLCGSNLEFYSGMATYNLYQILNANFSKSGKIKFIVMTGGSDMWWMESDYLVDPNADEDSQPEEISNLYNQIWEARGADADEYAGKLVLLDGDGIMGDGETARLSEDELMVDGDTVKAFVNYVVENYPAKKYDLIMWDHGMGPLDGFGGDEHDGVGGGRSMPAWELIDAIADNAVTENGGKFDFINFDACLMSSVDLIYAFSPYMDYYIASPETEPGYGQDYTGWLNALGANNEIDTYELGKILVDDFIKFYDKEEGDGASQEGTLGIINIEAFMNSGFVEALNDMIEIMHVQATEDLLFYDEFASYMDAIQYGSMNYYDLGGLFSKIAMDIKEVEPEDIIDAHNVNYENEYTETARKLGAILNNKEIIYARGTKGINSVPQYYRDSDGSITYGKLTTTGIYIYFFPSYYPTAISAYTRAMDDVVKILPDGVAKDFIEQYVDVITEYALISVLGVNVSQMVAETPEGETPEITVDALKAFMQEGNTFYYEEYDETYDLSDWGMYIETYLERLGYEDLPDWVRNIVKQQAEEAVDPDNIEVLSVEQEDGTGYRVNISDTRKRVIESVNILVEAELPSVAAYMEDPANEDILDLMEMSKGINVSKIGTITGRQLFSSDSLEDTTAADYLEWYLDHNSSWELDPLLQKWYAVKDASGTYHIIEPKFDEEANEIYFLVSYAGEADVDDEEDKVPAEGMAYLDFIDGKLYQIAFYTESGGYRAIEPDKLTEELTVMPIRHVDLFMGLLYADIPLSLNSFTVSADNYESLTIDYTDVSNIPDIEDTDGDGESLTLTSVVTDIYGYDIDINDKIRNPDGELIDISLVEVESVVYNGEAQSPVVKYDGEVLTEGEDFIVETTSDDDDLTSVGTYRVLLHGKGKYIRTAEKEFSIVPASYSFVSGDNSTWTIGSTGSLSVTVKRSVDDDKTFGFFTGISIDGNAVDGSNYTKEAGSVVISLNASYLDTLTPGEHTLVASFVDADTDEAKFTVTEAAPGDDTQPSEEETPGDDTQPTPPGTDATHAVLVWSVSAVTALIALAVLIILRKKFRS